MRTAILRILSLALTVAAIFAVGACGGKKTVEEGDTAPVMSADIDSGLADSDSGKAMGLQTVRYPYDSSVLDSKAKSTLKANAKILKEHGDLRVQIEGHTDERGGIQYNLALGERRAEAAKAFLVDQGVPSERLSVITYGKEKPVDSGHDESAWSQNRRANFRITEK